MRTIKIMKAFFIILIVAIGGYFILTNLNSEKIITTDTTNATVSVSVNTPPPEESRVSEIQNQKNETFLYIAIMVLSITTLVSVAISYYLYKWRRILLSRPNLIVPEEWGKYLYSVGKEVGMLREAFNIKMTHFSSETVNNTNKISDMTETYMSLQGALNEKDEEIRRLKEGYDSEVFRKFLLRFIRVSQSIDDYIELDDNALECFEQLKRLFEDAFDECGVEKFNPNIGDDYRTAEGVADNPKCIQTENSESNFLIAEIVSAGYRLRSNNNYKTIIPSKVKIFKIGSEVNR